MAKFTITIYFHDPDRETVVRPLQPLAGGQKTESHPRYLVFKTGGETVHVNHDQIHMFVIKEVVDDG